MNKLFFLLALLSHPVAAGTLTFDAVPGAAQYRVSIWSGAQIIGQSFVVTNRYDFDASLLPANYTFTVATMDADGNASAESMRAGPGVSMTAENLDTPGYGWKSVIGRTYDKIGVMRVGGKNWPTWNGTGGSSAGVPLSSPMVRVGAIYYCDWPYGLAECVWGQITQ